jgi:DNA-binding NarL/FixJ family response regulator
MGETCYKRVSAEFKETMPVRILLGNIGADWRATLAELARAENDLEIVGQVGDALDILLRTQELKPDVVVLVQLPGGGEPGVCSHLMLEHPNVAVLLLPTSSGLQVMWRMVLRKENWHQASKEAICAALKAHV